MTVVPPSTGAVSDIDRIVDWERAGCTIDGYAEHNLTDIAPGIWAARLVELRNAAEHLVAALAWDHTVREDGTPMDDTCPGCRALVRAVRVLGLDPATIGP